VVLGIHKKNSYKRFLSLAQEGKLQCAGCRTLLNLEDLKPLEITKCPECGTANFTPLKIRDYWLFQPLGGGGMGSVYKACNSKRPHEIVAVKVLQRTSLNDEERKQALFHEAEIAAQVGDHPLLVKALDWGSEKGETFVISEYVDGQRLDQAIEIQGRLPVPQVLNIARDLLDADKYIYNKGYLYRDLKPGNVFLNKKGHAVLFDYGLCVSLKEARNPEGDYCPGSPAYVPPERLWGFAEDAYSEIYSLGLLIYRALTGELFHQAQETGRLLKRHTSKLRVPVTNKLQGFDAALVHVISNMLEQEAENRYQTFDEVLAAIDKLMTE